MLLLNDKHCNMLSTSSMKSLVMLDKITVRIVIDVIASRSWNV